jgi:hypothetical protein
LNSACWFWRRRFFKILRVFLVFCYEGLSPSFEKLESSPFKDNLFHVWLKLALWFWRRRYLNDPWVKGIQGCSNKGLGPLQRGDNHKKIKMG